jgi:putative SOS response-associated peptidase YedK
MCGRYRMASDWSEIERRFGAKLADRLQPLEPRFNIAPTDEVVAIRRRRDSDELDARLLRWGLVPHWEKDARSGARMINAKAETLLDRPAFRSLVASHRCLIPADGFYEWRQANGRRPEPFDLTVKDSGLFAFAGLWAARKDDLTGDWLRSCTIITTRPNELVETLHNRMPVILPREAEADWLDPELAVEHAMSLLEPFPGERMVMRPVSPLVNSVQNDGPDLLIPEAESTLF